MLHRDGEHYDDVPAPEIARQGNPCRRVVYVSKPLLETEDSSPLHADEVYVHRQSWN